MKASFPFSSELNFFVYFFIFQVVNCLFEDQVGKFDWRQQYIGKVKFSYIDPGIAGTHKFIVATEENALACLSTRTGSIIWRQILEKGQLGEINALSQEGDLITINGNGQFIRSWDPNTGVLEWETSFPHVATKDAVQYFKVNALDKEIILIEMLPKKHTKVYIYSYTRASMKISQNIDSSWYDENTKCSFVSNKYFICYSKGSVTFLPIKSQGVHKFVAFDPNIKSESTSDFMSPIPYQDSSFSSVFAIVNSKEVTILQNKQTVDVGAVPHGLQKLKTLPTGSLVTSTLIDNDLVLFSISRMKDNNGNSTYKVIGMSKTKSEGTDELVEHSKLSEVNYLQGMFSLSEDRGELTNFFILPYIKKDQEVSYKMLLLFEDHSVLLVHHQGRILWFREEALSSIISTEIIDLPLSETDASIEQEFGQADASLISMFLTRLKSQVYLLQTFLLNTLIGFKGDINQIGGEKKSLTRDTFGLHKIIVVLTKPGKAFGVDNLSGLIVWSHFEKNFSPYVIEENLETPLFVQRTTAHFPYPPVCTAVGKLSNSNKSKIYSFDPITGRTLESKVLPYEVIQIMPVGSLDHYLRDILLLDSNLKVQVYPEKNNIYKHENKNFIFTGYSTNGTIIGYFLKQDKGNTLRAIEAWKVIFPEPIIKIATKRPFEQVHSQGRVMGDRSVLYKYSNPNLAAVFTEGNDIIQKTFCNVYLMDVITGLIVYSASHKRCRTPLHAVHSENWVVYSFYNDKSRRVEISSIELYEGMYQSNTTAFSSFAPPPLPLVEHQTYIFPSSIEAMADTITERGMTSKHILIALPSGGIFELPKTFLDPRRPIHPLPEHREEGLIPYIPELPIMADGMINYNQSINRVRKIVTAPSALESTCLVFVHGLDLFYTRVTPSKTFDILKDDFDHYLISVVLLGLLILSYTTKRLAARKTLRAAWK